MKIRQRIGVIGCGTMGTAILRGALEAGVVSARQLRGVDPSPAQRATIRRLGARVAASPRGLARASRVIILAVKPHEMPAVLGELTPSVTRRHLVISIAAGLSTRWFERRLGPGVPVVRAMPNMPAQVRHGITVLCGGRWARASHRAAARAIFDALGDTLELPERHFHAVTAVSGSGPAYVFHLMEQMVAAGRRLGIPSAALDRLVRQTVLGSAWLARVTGEPHAVLRARVTSKGGTTESALRVFARAGVGRGVIRGILAAARRSQQLGA